MDEDSLLLDEDLGEISSFECQGREIVIHLNSPASKSAREKLTPGNQVIGSVRFAERCGTLPKSEGANVRARNVYEGKETGFTRSIVSAHVLNGGKEIRLRTSSLHKFLEAFESYDIEYISDDCLDATPAEDIIPMDEDHKTPAEYLRRVQDKRGILSWLGNTFVPLPQISRSSGGPYLGANVNMNSGAAKNPSFPVAAGLKW